jgi:hypothetical protein
MKNLYTLLFILFSVNTFAQNSNKELNEMHQQIEKNRRSLDSNLNSLDSSMIYVNQFSDSMETVRRMETNNRNLTGLVSMMEERERKARQAIWLRIGLGLAGLIIAIIGFTRKKKVKSV